MNMNCHSSAMKSGEPITLMLVGGGIRFPAFIGALQAIEECGLRVSRIIASSAGAVVAGMYLHGYSPTEIMAEALAVDTRQFRDLSIRAMLTGFGLCSGDRLEEWLESRFGGVRFADKRNIPLEIVATDMLHYKPVIFSAEKTPDLKLSTAAAASCLVPGVFGYRKLEYGGKKYALIDGSLMTGIVEGRLDKKQKSLVIRVMSKRTLKRPENGGLSLKKYFHEMLTFSLHAQEKEFLKGGKWKDTILIYCSEISPSTFSLTDYEKRFLYEQGLEQTKKYLDYKWGGI